MSLGEKVDIKNWDGKKQRFKAYHSNATTLNTFLAELILFIDRTRMEYKIKGERLTSSELKRLIKNRLLGHNNSLFKEYAKQWVGDKQIKKGSLRTYVNAFNVIDRLFPKLTFDVINRKWRSDFMKKMSQYKPNYTATILKKFKECMQSAFIDGVHKNIYHQSSGFLVAFESVESVYLKMDQINDIYNNLSNFDEKYKNAAIIFLIGCLTGQRHQTYNLINKDMILIKSNTRMITIMTEKTKTRVSIPVSDKLEKLLNMDYHSITQQRLNEYIKEVCRKCEIEFYDKVSSHTARRSFATNAVIQGMQLSQIMKITGHTTEKEFRKYVRLDDVLSAEMSASEIQKMQG
jgi:integrase